uniref:molybdate ABC transporter substrate-binding protein n=1 Tax=uncultured Sphingomonas sp. TaxID=158754 RepID=UPI0025F76C81|nr:molybdate ABC transporter substrate-binding protein [uncultured Sphingomonas sp.]
MVVALTFLLGACAQQPQERAPLVLAAASLQEALNAAADAWAAEGHRRPTLSFAASSALARQVESGAEADLFISADREWMDHVAQAGRIRPDSRRDLAGNALVLIAPRSKSQPPAALRRNELVRALGDGRLAMADPDSVPAGKYGKAALQSLDLWSAVEQRVARAENVRAALALVERGEAPLGIVYATDANASEKVRVAATFPPNSHPPITYPIALLSDASSEAEAFYRFLLSDRGRAIFAAHGFTAPPPG